MCVGAIWFSTVRPPDHRLTDLRSDLDFEKNRLLTSPPVDVVERHLAELTRGRDVLVWNADHESRLFEYFGRTCRLQDLMVRCAPLLRPWNEHFANYQWPKLLKDGAGASFRGRRPRCGR